MTKTKRLGYREVWKRETWSTQTAMIAVLAAVVLGFAELGFWAFGLAQPDPMNVVGALVFSWVWLQSVLWRRRALEAEKLSTPTVVAYEYSTKGAADIARTVERRRSLIRHRA